MNKWNCIGVDGDATPGPNPNIIRTLNKVFMYNHLLNQVNDEKEASISLTQYHYYIFLINKQ